MSKICKGKKSTAPHACWKKEFGKAAFASGWLVTLNPPARS
jgi:hypothetical protein